jgi:hypothetical protein
MIDSLRSTCAAALLLGPTGLAFFSGGFFDQPRLWAGLAAWALVAAAALISERPLPGSPPAVLAVGGLAALTAWTGLSLVWAPLSSAAFDDLQRLLLYLGALLAAVALLRGGVARAVEPTLALGTLAVVGYGLSGRLLPGAIEQRESTSALGRLEQPLTYWNAMGALAAVGLVLCARLAGDESRPAWMRSAAAASAVPLGAGLYLSFSRGALVAAAAGLVLLPILTLRRSQLRAAALAVGAAVSGALATGPFDGVRSLAGSDSARSVEGAVSLALLAALAVAAGLLQKRRSIAERSEPDRVEALTLPRRAAVLGAAIAVLLAGGLVAVAVRENRQGSRPAATGATAERFGSLQSDRPDYWRVALDAFVEHPIRGVGSGGFRAEWLRERPVAETALDAHSLELETAAELGIVGLFALGAAIGGVAWATVVVRRLDPRLAAGPTAGLAVWLVHATLDWDWEMPALTLVAIVLAGMLCAAADPENPPLR